MYAATKAKHEAETRQMENILAGKNDRAWVDAALQKLGAVRQGVIPNGLVLADRTYDQYYWTLSADGRPRKKIVWDLGTH